MFCKTDIAEKRRHGTLLCVGLQVLSRHRIPKFRVPQKVMFSSNGLNESPGRNCPESTPENTHGLSQKIQGTYFKISALYFKIYALYFWFFGMTDTQ